MKGGMEIEARNVNGRLGMPLSKAGEVGQREPIVDRLAY